MDKSLGESHQACNHGDDSANWSQRINRFLEEFPYPPLNLTLTITPELISSIESVVQEPYPCPYQQKSPTIIHPQTPTPSEKKAPNPLHIEISRITIGTWSRVSVNQQDITAKFYFAKKRLIWEILYSKEETNLDKSLMKKIEMRWADVSSLKLSDLPDGTQVLVIELSKPPTFFEEVPSSSHTKWKPMDHDFTLNNSASICRRHFLYVSPRHGNLKKNLEKLASLDSFWSQRFKVHFPCFQYPFFDSPVGNNNNNGNNPGHYNPGHYIHDQTWSDLCFNPNNNNNNGNNPGHYNPGHYIHNNNVHYPAPYSQAQTFSFNVNNNDLVHHQPQGFGHMEVGESSTGPHLCSRVSQGMNQLPQAFPNPLLETQTNSRMFRNTNELSRYPQLGPYALRHEEERQNHDDDIDELSDEFWDQLFGNIDGGSLPPDF